MVRTSTILIIIITLFASCKSSNKLFEKGKYRQLINNVLKKESRHKASKDDIIHLEKSYQLLQKDYLRKISLAEASNSEGKWEQIYINANALSLLQEHIQRYEPIKAKNGYQAKFTFENVEQIQQKAGKNAAIYYLKIADQKYTIAAKNIDDYKTAREAYDAYEKVKKYDSTHDVDEAMRVMKEIGTIVIGTEINGRSRYSDRVSRTRKILRRLGGNRSDESISNYQVERKLDNMLDFSDSKWIDRRDAPFKRKDVDYVIALSLEDIDIDYSERNRTVNHYTENKTKVVKDSLGNERTIVIGTYKATVERIEEEKQVEVEIELEIENPHDSSERFSREYYESEEDKAVICNVSGDSRAIPSNSDCKGSNSSLDTNKDMIIEALDDMKYRVRRDIRNFIEEL